jgi:hypothetical protein
MKRVPLVNSKKTAQVDDEDWALVSRFRWHLSPEGTAVTWIHGELVEMGYLIMNPHLADDAPGAN